MPLDPITSAVISSIISSVAEGMLTTPPPVPTTGIIRMMPEEAKSGSMLPLAQWQVQIDGKTYPLSPGIQIRNELNMIVPPTMVDRPVRVRYVTDFSGAVHRVWILSSAEASLPENR